MNFSIKIFLTDICSVFQICLFKNLCNRVLKAARLKRKWRQFQIEKEVGLNEDESDSEFSRQETFKRKFWLSKFLRYIKSPETVGNFVFKSLIGFLGGVLLTYIFFFFFHVGVNFSIRTTTYICGLAGIVLSLGLAFSSQVRCYVLLMLPVFFSKQGRQALLAYALFLAFTGPGRNTTHNLGILSDSMTCGQEVVRRTLKQVIDMVKAPFRSVKQTIEKITKALKEVVESVKTFVMKIKRVIVAVLKVIKKATSWLGSIISFCNKKIGTPFQRCMKTFDDAIADCKAKLGVMDFLCHVVHIIKALCYTVKWLDFICMFTEFVSEKVIGVVKRKLRQFNLQMKNLFYVSVEFTHTYEFETKASESPKEIAETILKKVSDKVEKLQSIFSFFGFMFSFFFLFVFFKVYYYKYKYMSSDRYDNVYISKYIVDLDIKRALMDRETVLPLEPRERKKYATPTAVRLLTVERNRMMQSMFFLSLTSFKIITFLVIDYSLYWVLITIYQAGRDELEEDENYKIALHVQGGGILAQFYRSLGNTFMVPENPNMHLTPLHCLPDPIEPDMGRYIQIGFLVTLCWLLTVTEAYGLRLRNVVMSHYYPDRAKERAAWLYNNILRTRGSYLRFVRRQLRRKFGGENLQPIEKVTLTQRLFANFPLLGAIFGRSKENNCLLCGTPETKAAPLKRCKTPDCPGRFCLKCFAGLENVCTICQHPIEYGDVSDISEEIDSSEEELYNRKHRSESSDSSKYMTFKDMELRDRFKDVESNKKPDFVKLSDLYPDKESLKRRINEVLHKRLKRLQEEKDRETRIKESTYRKLKLKAQRLLRSKKNKKFQASEGEEHESLLGEETEKENPKLHYENLKNKIRERIRSLKEKQNFKENKKPPTGQEDGGKSSEDEIPKNSLVPYYHVESESGSTDQNWGEDFPNSNTNRKTKIINYSNS